MSDTNSLTIKTHIHNTLKNRSTAKAYTNQAISDDDFAILLDSLRLAPSSTNLQPWHFIVADDDAGKQRIAKGTQGMFEMNLAKVTNASHVVVICHKVYANAQHLHDVVTKEGEDGRYATDDLQQHALEVKSTFLGIHRHERKDETHWHLAQSYIALGFLLLTAANLGIDATPIEGVDIRALNQEFDLPAKDLSAVAVLALGYRSDDDFNAKLPKSRLPKDVVFSKA